MDIDVETVLTAHHQLPFLFIPDKKIGLGAGRRGAPGISQFRPPGPVVGCGPGEPELAQGRQGVGQSQELGVSAAGAGDISQSPDRT